MANVVTNTLGCSDDDCGTGIETPGGTGNLIAANLVTGTTDQGIRLREFEADGGPPTIGNVIRGNIVRDAGSDGIALQDKTNEVTGHGTVKDNLVANNLVTGSGHDGINVSRPANTVSGNVALRNDVLGIEAVDGRDRRRRQPRLRQRRSAPVPARRLSLTVGAGIIAGRAAGRSWHVRGRRLAGQGAGPAVRRALSSPRAQPARQPAPATSPSARCRRSPVIPAYDAHVRATSPARATMR